jgi:hypothetical protein
VAEPNSGYQPRNTPAERRAFFDLQKQLDELRALIAGTTTTLADHETRITALEPP